MKNKREIIKDEQKWKELLIRCLAYGYELKKIQQNTNNGANSANSNQYKSNAFDQDFSAITPSSDAILAAKRDADAIFFKFNHPICFELLQCIIKFKKIFITIYKIITNKIRVFKKIKRFI